MKQSFQLYHSFTQNLLHWHATSNQRELPWKSEKDPYKIWLSEIILQQTRAAQGLPYYIKFITAYPKVADLANAPFEEVMKLWQGLGYYSRCANLIKAAQIISNDYNGIFPEEYEKILALPGVGPYTAAAIASFAFQLPYPVIDGNVFRVLSRYFGIQEPVDTTKGKKMIIVQAEALIDRNNAADYNQAIMDLGATICKPQNPECEQCPVMEYCIAYKKELQQLLPIKIKKIKISHRYFHYILLEWKEGIYMEERSGKDIWKYLYQPMLVEKHNSEALSQKELPAWIRASQLQYLGAEKQQLTHQQIHTIWYHLTIENIEITPFKKTQFLSKNKLKNIAFPKSIFSFMSKNNYF